MADTRASDGRADALDEALAAALAQALSRLPAGGLKLTKRARLKRHRDAIVALRAKRWSWAEIAVMLTGAGLDVSPRTLRSEMTAPKKSVERRPFGERESGAGRKSAAEKRGPTALASAQTSAADERNMGQQDHRVTERPPTESGFFTIDLEDN